MNRQIKPFKRYIFGSSNVCKIYDKNCEVHSQYNLKRARNLHMLESELSKFRENGASIIISMVENAIEDGLRQALDEKKAVDGGKNAISRFYKILEQEAIKFRPV